MSQQTIRNVPRGEYVRLTPNGPVWVRGDYVRAEARYELQSADDMNRYIYRKGNVMVYIGFTY